MKPTYDELAQTLKLISNEGVPLHLMRQDFVYDLYRRGALTLIAGDKLIISPLGKAVLEKLKAGERAVELEGE